MATPSFEGPCGETRGVSGLGAATAGLLSEGDFKGGM